MRTTRSIMLLALLLCVLLLAPVAEAAVSSAGYAINWQVIGGGAGPQMSNSSYGLNSTVGQTAIGWSENGHGLGSGYWYGVGAQYAVYLPLVLKQS